MIGWLTCRQTSFFIAWYTKSTYSIWLKIFCIILFSKFLTRGYILFFVPLSLLADFGTFWLDTYIKIIVIWRDHTVKSTVRSMTTRLFTWYFRFQNTCNRNKFVWVSGWISGIYITKSCKECHWTPFYPLNTLRGREYHFPVVRMFLHEFLINSGQKHPYIEEHTSLSQKWLLSISWLMYCSIILTNNFRNTIFYSKVITIKNVFYLHEQLAIKRVIWLKLLTLVYFKHVFYNCKISQHEIFNMHELL